MMIKIKNYVYRWILMFGPTKPDYKYEAKDLPRKTKLNMALVETNSFNKWIFFIFHSKKRKAIHAKDLLYI